MNRLSDRPQTTSLACPAWCLRHTVSPDGYAIHTGPEWMLDVPDHDIEIELERGDEPGGVGDSTAVLAADGSVVMDLTADQLRELAAYALAAADRLDGDGAK